ncbi:MAG: adenine deaminase [Candidatus Cloacimonadales bacterium]|nr:adenine deaminase [Candidatus Cloacimonadales bacterium]
MNKIEANLVDIISTEIFPARLFWEEGRICKIEKINKKMKNCLIPGFVDAHIHIESSLLTPVEFGKKAVQHGTVAVVADPHEIANVLGIEGVKFMIENGKRSPLKFFWGAPSCVPATTFETSGAELGQAEIEELLKMNEITHLSEMMNYPGVIFGDEIVLKKIEIAKKLYKPIDGHAPGLSGEDLKKYVKAGISTDHECFTQQEALEKLALGMKILIREGSASKEFDELIPIAKNNFNNCLFCSDDLHPHDLQKGHINLLVKRALKSGLDIFKVLKMASQNPAKHYKLEIGLLQIGDPADFLVVDDLQNLHILETYIDGEPTIEYTDDQFAVETKNKFNTKPKTIEDFQIPAKTGKIRIIEAKDRRLITGSKLVKPLIRNGFAVADPKRDLLKIAVVNRYQNVKPALGFIHGFGLKSGAIASSVAHDSHNIIAIGVDDNSVLKAVNTLIANKGGICTVDADSAEILPLPIAGIISDKSCTEVAEKYEILEEKAKDLGCKLTAPFMTMSFMALLVIPELKMSDKGLFDGTKFEFVDLWID